MDDLMTGAVVAMVSLGEAMGIPTLGAAHKVDLVGVGEVARVKGQDVRDSLPF